jgi:Leucine-rich repeat (LRR) protein
MKFSIITLVLFFSINVAFSQSKVINKINRLLKKSDKIESLKINFNTQDELNFVLEHLQNFKSLKTLKLLKKSFGPNCYINEKLFIPQKLEVLLISSCNLSSIATHLDSLKNLKRLGLFDCDFHEIPLSIFKLNNLEEFYFQADSIKSVPDQISKLRNLKYVDLRSNGFDEFPIAICNLPNLERLDIGNYYSEYDVYAVGNSSILLYNSIKELPKCINNLSKLKYLTIPENTNTKNIEELIENKQIKIYRTK